MRLVFGYKHVIGIPSCPCSDPGNYALLEEEDDNPLLIRLTCWCGAKLRGEFASMEERAEFLTKNGVDT